MVSLRAPGQRERRPPARRHEGASGPNALPVLEVRAAATILASGLDEPRQISTPLIEHLAEKLWDSRIKCLEGPWAWADAGATWQAAFREMVVAVRPPS